ncbi:uncharacterized protein V3H82_026745 [Fundulus diaphanus]
MTPPKSPATCPICEYDFNYLVQGCGYSKSRVDRHLDTGHPEVDDGEMEKIIKKVKKEVTIAALRALRATDPSPPVISNLDLSQDDNQEMVSETVSEPDGPTCSSCSKMAAQNRELWKQLRTKQRWIKKAKAKIRAYKEQAPQKTSGGGSVEPDQGSSEQVDPPEDEAEDSSSEEPKKAAESRFPLRGFKDFPAPILEYMEEYWLYLRGAIGSTKHVENQKSKLGRVMSFLRFVNKGRTVLPNWTFLLDIDRVHQWPAKLLREGKAENTTRNYLLNVMEFAGYFRDTPPTTSRVPKKAVIGLLRTVSADIKQLRRDINNRQINVKKRKIGRVIAKEDLRRCQRQACRKIPKLLDTIQTDPSSLNIRRFYGYFSVYLASIYGHRTGVLTNMTLAEVDEARVDARMADQGFVINVKEHKTNRAFGPAQVYLTVEEFGWLEQWLQVRETLQPSTDLVFFNENYQKIQNLQHHLQSAWAEMGFSGSPTFTDFRTSIATYARDALSPGTRTKVSKTMCHDTATAEKFYAMHQTAEQLCELRKRFQEATEPSVSGPGEVAEPVTPRSSSDEGEGEGPVKKKRRLAPRVGSTSQESPEAQAESPAGQAESPEGCGSACGGAHRRGMCFDRGV